MNDDEGHKKKENKRIILKIIMMIYIPIDRQREKSIDRDRQAKRLTEMQIDSRIDRKTTYR